MVDAQAGAAQRVAVDTGRERYDILIGRGLIDQADTWAGLPAARDGVIVTDANVGPRWLARLQAAIGPVHRRLSAVTLPAGEEHKRWASLETLFEHLLSQASDRKTVLYALGGGVVGDMTGFAAGCYQRGVPFVQVPTTLLAQVDSSVGGKTAINHPLGKNMIGLFYQPRRVVCDLVTLDTLPPRELAAGLAEVIKYGPIADAEFYGWVEERLDALLARDEAALAHAVRRSCEIKAEVVGQDERESGLRAILNFGHTFGHAIETGVGYGAWLHGEAVACGMLIAADLSARLGLIDAAEVPRLEALLRRAGLPVRAPDLGLDRWFALMGRDKKTEGGAVRFVLLEAIGRAVLRSAPDALVAAVIETAVRRSA
jgi:3-dehydroquinate synthase